MIRGRDGPRPHAAILARIFGPTRQESRPALALESGDGVAKAAADLGISVGTARFHLAAIFRETGTGRQSDLIRLPSPVPSDLLSAAENEASGAG